MVKILSISFQRSRACLTLDDDRQVWLSRADLLESGWQENTAVEEEAFDRLQDVMEEAGELKMRVPFDEIVDNSRAEQID